MFLRCHLVDVLPIFRRSATVSTSLFSEDSAASESSIVLGIRSMAAKAFALFSTKRNRRQFLDTCLQSGKAGEVCERRWEVLSLLRSPMNLHTGYLPFNQGSHPNVWSIVEGTPAGVTLHLMAPEVDSGELIARREVPVPPAETGSSLYTKLEKMSVELIGTVFPSLLTGEIRPSPMPEGGTFHFASEFDGLCALSLDETLNVGDFLRRLRASKSFNPHPPAAGDAEDLYRCFGE